jgi:hypothetical protein
LRWSGHAAGPTATAADAHDIKGPKGSWRAYPLLLSFIPFIVVQAGVYTFLGEFGRVAANLSVEARLHAIGISVVLSSLGSVAAYWLNDKVGFKLPIGGAVLLMTGMLFGMILGSRSAASRSSALGSVVGASAMGYVLDHGGMTGSLVLTVGCMILTVLLTLPFLRSHASETTAKSLN